MNRLVTFVQYGVIWLACVLAISRVAKGDTPRPMQNVVVTIDDVGDARVKLDFPVTEGMSKKLKEARVGGETLLRLCRLDNLVQPRDEFRVKYGGATDVTVEYAIAGLARRNGDRWDIDLLPWGDLATVRNGQLSLTADGVQCDHALMNRKVTFAFPKAAGEPTLASGKASLTLPAPPARTGSAAKAAFDLDVQPLLMGCMAKSYGYERFASLWAGRTVLKNTGDQPVTDYRVRYRLSEFTADWSPWSRTASILPGQTVVDGYFPLLNIDKISALQGRRQAVLEVEYEYRLGNGQAVRETDAQKVEILGKNEPTFTSVPADQAFGWLDQHANVPFVLASFVTKDDPVIRMAAGHISGQMKGSPSLDAFDAVEFVRQTHVYLKHNKIAYQTPPVSGGLQHVMYGRDVLANHAGTCIDLAIFYASVGEAVGLQPALCVPPGHCFPMFKMPRMDNYPATDKSDKAAKARERQAAWDKEWAPRCVKIGDDYYLPFESTALTPTFKFELAVERGAENFKNTPVMGRVDIASLRNQGVYPLELPDLGANALTSWQITPAAAGKGGQPAAKEIGDPAKLIVGTWRADVAIGGQQMYILGTFKDDGTVSATIYNAANTPLNTGGGNWSFAADGTYQFRGAFEEDAKLTWQDADTYVYTCLKTTNPLGVVGARVTNKRVK